MPGGDGTGPMGMGPMTGRAAGYCAGFAVPGFMNRFAGPGRMGFGRGFGGGGRGWRNQFYATGLPGWMRAGAVAPWAAPVAAPGADAQAQALKQEVEFLEGSLAEVRKRLAEIEKESQEK